MNGRTHARTGVTLNAPPPFFEWRGHKKLKGREGGREGEICKKNVSIEHRGATALDTAFTLDPKVCP